MIKNKRRKKTAPNRAKHGRKTRRSRKVTQAKTEIVDEADADEPMDLDRFANYVGTRKLKKVKEKPTLIDPMTESKPSTADEGHPSIMAKEPLKKRLSVQFYPVERVQFISNRLGKTEK